MRAPSMGALSIFIDILREIEVKTASATPML